MFRSASTVLRLKCLHFLLYLYYLLRCSAKPPKHLMAPMTKLFLLVVIPLFLLGFCCGCFPSEREALLRIEQNSSDPSPYDTFYSWESGTDCCDWEGILCNNDTHHVDGVFLSGLDTVEVGIIWQSLCTLTFLEIIYIPDNEISGTLSSCLGNLSSLTELDLGGNILSGTIPLSFANMSSLYFLDLFANNLQGENVVSTICMLMSLSYVNLGSNQLSGSLPSCLGSLSFLTKLYLSDNHFSGNIPDSLGKISSLTDFDVSDNALSGCVPDSLGGLSSLEHLDLSYNQLNGTLPSSFSRLTSLKHLGIKGNAFEQSISSSALPSSVEYLYLTLNGHQIISEGFFQNLSKLVKLSLSDFELNVSTTWIPLFQLSSLYMTSCKIDGQIPSWISTQFSLYALQLSGNNLVGEIPSWLMGMSQLHYINLTANNLKGRLLLNTSTQNLYALDVSHNALSGQLPPIWLPHMQVLLLNNNFLMGSIPSSLQFSSSLEILDLSNNHLNGMIPPSLANCSTLKMLNLGNNNLGEVIPYEFGRLSQLEALVMENNKLNGSFPSPISNCTNLYFLDVGKNLLKGHIPKSIGNLSKLKVLAMRKNNFEGSIPFEIGQLKFLQILDLSSNHLSGAIPHSIFNLQAMMTEPHEEFSVSQFYTIASISISYKNGLKMDSKGRDEHYTYIFPSMVSIELSNNQLNGDIPSDLGKLKGMKLLNLSMNNLNGTIPDSIVQMNWLETLDFSTNNFSGPIPLDLGSLSYLGALNFSNNNFSGSIPQGGHMTTFNKLSYLGNPNLWGCPLPKKCSWPEFVSIPPPVSTTINEEETSEESVWYEIGLGLSYGAGFAAVVLIIVLKEKWGHKYFQGVDMVLTFLFPWLRNLTL